MRTLNSSGTPRRTPKVVRRTTLDEITNADQQVEQRGLAGRGLRVAAARHLDRVERGAGALLDHLGRGARVLGHDAPAPQLPDLADHHGSDRAERDGAHQQRALLEAVELWKRRRIGTAKLWRTGRLSPAGPPPGPRARARAGTPITTARGSTSRVTTAPAATNASSPIVIPGRSTAPAPDSRRAADARSAQRLARRMPAHRVVVRGHHPGSDERVLLDHRVGGQVAVRLDPRPAPTCTSLSSPQPRPITAPAPIRQRSRTWRLVAHDRALAQLRARVHDRAGADHRAGAHPQRRQWLARRGRSRAQAGALAEHRAVLDLAAVAHDRAAVDHDPGAQLDVLAQLHVVAQHQARREVGRVHAVLHPPGAAAGSSACGTPPASSERCSASRTRTARRPLAGPERGSDAVAHAFDEVPALDPQRLLVGDLRAHHVARAGDVLAVVAEVGGSNPLS